jgi:hypothetical protein
MYMGSILGEAKGAILFFFVIAFLIYFLGFTLVRNYLQADSKLDAEQAEQAASFPN